MEIAIFAIFAICSTIIQTVDHTQGAKHMAKSRLGPVAPDTVNRTVTPKRRRSADLRTREYLTEAEVERLLRATKGNRWKHREATMILVAYRHGLRASKLRKHASAFFLIGGPEVG
jgi:hypothetical protein